MTGELGKLTKVFDEETYAKYMHDAAANFIRVQSICGIPLPLNWMDLSVHAKRIEILKAHCHLKLAHPAQAHLTWVSELLNLGWNVGSLDVYSKSHPMLVEWSALSDREKFLVHVEHEAVFQLADWAMESSSEKPIDATDVA